MFYQMLGWLVLASTLCADAEIQALNFGNTPWFSMAPWIPTENGRAQRLQRRQRCHDPGAREAAAALLGDADDEETKVSQDEKKLELEEHFRSVKDFVGRFVTFTPAEQSLVKTQQLLERTVVPKMPVESRGKYLLIWYDSKIAGESVFHGAMFLESVGRGLLILLFSYIVSSLGSRW